MHAQKDFTGRHIEISESTGLKQNSANNFVVRGNDSTVAGGISASNRMCKVSLIPVHPREM